ncbi:hypothetical protein BDP81DRAFT_191465 [Colletotrichum phormii]|uniref:Uncharacterized protein n=1 Tax=Colletotrichum phormii TaxID=359342 RepID=A0AAJ0EH31_9PEZI|nr:uncharacterized protein BDP81DRAFT_191465 [Colletotrichum phormii]KAK1638783.1 hypothetical protein BDP81DRAFT_191465 [Colletotrichum phormii]
MFFWRREVDLWVVLVIVRGEKRWSDFLNATRLRPWHQATCSRRHLMPHVDIGCDPVRVMVLDLPCQSVFRRWRKMFLDPMAFWVRNACCTLVVEVSVSGGSTEENSRRSEVGAAAGRAESPLRDMVRYLQGTYSAPSAAAVRRPGLSMVSQGEDGDWKGEGGADGRETPLLSSAAHVSPLQLAT